MKTEEFEEQSKRIESYNKILNRLNKLKTEQRNIRDGVLSIIAAYQIEIKLDSGYDFNRNLANGICEVYQKEIDKLTALLNEI